MVETLATDVAIVGGGPAGIAAAIRLRHRGVGRITILEREGEIGGIPRHCGHPPFGMREFGRILAGPAYARRLSDAASRAGIEIRTRISVVALKEKGRLEAISVNGPLEINARRVILATGARENSRAARLISGDRPIGVITTGTLQNEIYIEGLLPFRRPVIVGTELVSLSAVLTCLKAGIQPVAVIETAERSVARHPLDLFPRLFGIPMHYGVAITDISGRKRVESVTIRLPDGSSREVVCDGVLLTGRFVPEASLVRASHLQLDTNSGGPVIDEFGRCTDPVIFAAGNLLRPIETAGWSYREGMHIGDMVANDLAGRLPGRGVEIRIACGNHIKLAVPQRLTTSYHPPFLDRLQIRMQAPVTGELVARNGQTVLWRRHGRFLPERRILIPLSALKRQGGSDGEIIIELVTSKVA